MSNFDTVVLDGEMGLFTKVKEGDLPYYTGETEVTPSNETQTLPTADTIVTSNIIINPIQDIDLEEVQVTYTPDEEGQTDTITPSTGYAGISEVEVTIEPIDPEYVGSDIPRMDSEDLTVSGALVTVPAGFYESGASASVPGGTEGTPVATKGSVSNHSIAVTPSVTNSAGYIAGGTKTGTAVTVSAAELVSGSQTITSNQTVDVTNLEEVVVAVPGSTPVMQTKSVSYTPTETAQSESVTPSAGYDGLDKVNVSVGAIDSEYVGSDVPRKSSSDLSSSGATVTAPAGYYESAASKAVASGSASTPATSITANPSISVSASGLITATASASQSVTPTVSAGYVASGTAGTVSVSGSATQQLSTQSATTITPTTSSQTAVSAGKYTTGAVTVDPIPSQYIVPTGTKTITENGTGIDVAAYAAVDVNVSGGGGLEEKAVNFYDYDGELLYAYTAQEFAALDAMPDNPSHTGLTAQGWNWSLSDAKTYIAAYPDAILNIGQMYTTASGATEIDVTLDDLTTKPYLAVSPNGTVNIDWGDNTSDTVTGTSLTTVKWTQHIYSAPGDYTIKISADSGTYALYSDRTGNESSTMQYTNSWQNARTYASTIKAIRVGANVSQIGNFISLTMLETITVPSTVTSFGRFIRCYSLKGLTVPSGITSIGANDGLNVCKFFSIPNGITSIPGDFIPASLALTSLTIPSTVTTVSNYAFRNAWGLKKALIPASVTSLGTGVFHSCRSLQYVFIKNSATAVTGDFCRECFALERVEFPASVTEIGGFYNCNSLEKVTIPATVTAIGNGAFQGCYSMTEMHVLPTAPPTLGNNVSLSGFANNVVIYVPAASLSDYQSATNWSSWASKMQGE